MARIEWVKHRLNNWAFWKVRESSGGLGFHTQAAFLGDCNSDRYRESVIPVDDVDAELTNQAVESLRIDRSHLHQTLQLIYIEGIGIKMTARRMARAESTIKANLDQSDAVLSAWFTDRANMAEARKKSLTT
ncbi:MAG TPA: hypothetical protein VIK56_00705 [Rhodoferax sp.]